jgi:hypothetical protein
MERKPFTKAAQRAADQQELAIQATAQVDSCADDPEIFTLPFYVPEEDTVRSYFIDITDATDDEVVDLVVDIIEAVEARGCLTVEALDETVGEFLTLVYDDEGSKLEEYATKKTKELQRTLDQIEKIIFEMFKSE